MVFRNRIRLEKRTETTSFEVGLEVLIWTQYDVKLNFDHLEIGKVLFQLNLKLRNIYFEIEFLVFKIVREKKIFFFFLNINIIMEEQPDTLFRDEFRDNFVEVCKLLLKVF